MATHVISKTLRNACFRGAEVFFSDCTRRIQKSLPIPSDYEPVATVCYYTGMYGHREFVLLINISDIEGDFLKKQCCIEVEVGDSRVQATAIPVSKDGKLSNVLSRASVRVRMSESELSVNVYRKQIMTRILLCKLVLNIDKDVVEAKFPQNKWYALSDKTRNLGRIRLSFYKLDTSLSVIDNIVLQQAIIMATEYNSAGIDLKVNVLHPDIMSQAEKLVLLSFALEGPLIAKEGYASQMRYFKSYLRNGRWFWSYWNSKPECRANRKPEESINLMSIEAILKHPTDYTFIYVRYYKKNQPRELLLKTVERSRDIWADSLHLFIQTMRDYVERFDDLSAVEDLVN